MIDCALRKRSSIKSSTADLERRAARVTAASVDSTTVRNRDIVDQIDNASLQVKHRHERLRATTLCSDMAPWTATGTAFLQKEAGYRRHTKNQSSSQHMEGTSEVPNWVATNRDSPLYGFCLHANQRGPKPCMWCAWPPDVQLPNDAQLLSEAAFKRYDGHSAGVMEILPDILNLSPALSPVTLVPQDKLLRHALREELKQTIARSIVRNGSLNDVSTAIPEVKPTQFLQNVICDYSWKAPWQPLSRTCVRTDYEGWAARSKATNPSSWDGEDKVRCVEYQQHPPIREDEMSAVGNMRVTMDAARRHGYLYSGWCAACSTSLRVVNVVDTWRGHMSRTGVVDNTRVVDLWASLKSTTSASTTYVSRTRPLHVSWTCVVDDDSCHVSWTPPLTMTSVIAPPGQAVAATGRRGQTTVHRVGCWNSRTAKRQHQVDRDYGATGGVSYNGRCAVRGRGLVYA